ncbi:MAG: hypothetical protein QW273_02100 [Candidatus Pacearchaeota archaeon]
MISWLLIIVVILLILALMKLEHLSRVALIVFFILLILGLFISIKIVSNENKLDFSSPKGILNSFVIYGKWVDVKLKSAFNSTKTTLRVLDDSFKK